MENPWIPSSLKASGFPSLKQGLFLTVPCDEIFYGGAAGGGKSAGLLAGALQYVDVPRYSALLLRKTYADLAKPGALLDLAHDWLRTTGAHWSERDRRWTFPSGAILSFGYLDAEKDKLQYQSASYQYIGPDETTHYSNTQYTYMFSRLRPEVGIDVPLRMRTASNPGAAGHEWVKKRFISNSTPLQIRYIRDEDKVVRSRLFIPALLGENPGLKKEDYEKQLAGLDPVTKAQLKNGDWDIHASGNMFKRESFKIESVKPAGSLPCVRAWDLAATEGAGDYLVGTKMSRSPEGKYYIEHVFRDQLGPHETEKAVIQKAKTDGQRVRVRGEQEPGASGKIVAANWIKLLAGYDVKFTPSTGDKTTRARPLSAQCEAGNVILVDTGWDIEGWLDRMRAFPQEGVPDDEPDSASMAFNALNNEFIREEGDLGYS